MVVILQMMMEVKPRCSYCIRVLWLRLVGLNRGVTHISEPCGVMSMTTAFKIPLDNSSPQLSCIRDRLVISLIKPKSTVVFGLKN